MNLSERDILLVAALGGLALISIFFMVRLYKIVHDLNSSFAKLGYVTREDAKKYFEEAAGKAVDMNNSFYEQNQKVVEAGVRKVVAEGGNAIQGSIIKAEKEAADILLKAHQEAMQIVADAKSQSQAYFDRSLNESTEAIEWAMEQYLKDNYSLAQHQDLIDKLIKIYADEHRH